VPGILALDAALSQYRANQAQWIANMYACKLRLWENLRQLPDVFLNGPKPESGAPHILNVSLPAVRTVVKIGDTVSDIEEARAAGVWAVGVVDGSSVMGLSHAEFSALTDAEKAAARIRARSVLLAAGADFVIESLSELPGLIDGINARQGR
jgi:phosphoglycolate phosphatase-like HAD superfamily hydrolase